MPKERANIYIDAKILQALRDAGINRSKLAELLFRDYLLSQRVSTLDEFNTHVCYPGRGCGKLFFKRELTKVRWASGAVGYLCDECKAKEYEKKAFCLIEQEYKR